MMWLKIRAGDAGGVAAALTPLLGHSTTTRLGLAPGLAMQDMGFPHLSFPIISGRRASSPGLRHSRTLRPASEMVVTEPEGRRRSQRFFFSFLFFWSRELAADGISVASLDVASWRHVSAP